MGGQAGEQGQDGEETEAEEEEGERETNVTSAPAAARIEPLLEVTGGQAVTLPRVAQGDPHELDDYDYDDDDDEDDDLVIVAEPDDDDLGLGFDAMEILERATEALAVGSGDRARLAELASVDDATLQYASVPLRQSRLCHPANPSGTFTTCPCTLISTRFMSFILLPGEHIICFLFHGLPLMWSMRCHSSRNALNL